ncbi:MAG: ABC transporter ATP-binding protein [Bacillota bacterium]|nr:ABC transporter ATP-binding protein [Bacillota bacterium]
MLDLENVYAGYGAGDILQGTSLAVPAGAITCVVGPNGAGKSTVLKTISGLLRPRAGEVRYRGRRIDGLSAPEILRAGIVQVPQSGIVFPSMSVRENVLMGGFVLRDRRLVERRLRAVEELFPLVRERARERAATLSGGQQRIVAFARALMLDPELILLDEPSTGLDPRSLAHVFEAVGRMRAAGKTVLMVEQNVRAGLGVADRAVVMESGRVVLEGSALAIREEPELASLYLGGAVARPATG